MPAVVASTAAAAASGAVRVIVTVDGSVASTEAMPAIVPAISDLGSVFHRSSEAFTAAASTGAPEWKVTPSRRVRISWVPSSENSHDSASMGWSS